MSEFSTSTGPVYDFFLAHSGRAMPAAEELYHHLEGREGARVFLDKHGIPEGAAWPAELDKALRSSRIAVVLITPTVLTSFYVIEEIQRAIGLMRSFGSPVIVPVYLDGTAPDNDTPYGLSGLQSITVPPGSGLGDVADRLLDVSKRLAAQPAPGAAAAPGTSGPAELVVDPRGGSGTYSSIRRALDNAGPDARILIRPGLYEEALTITQPVSLIGDGPVESIILQSFNATTITLSAAGGTIDGITVRQQGGTFSYQAIDVAAGMPTIRRCVITGGTRSCIRARGTSTPVIELNVITGVAAVGVELGDFSSAQVRRNWVFALAETGVWIGGRSHPIVEANVVEGCVVHGIKLEDEARAALVSNDVRECGRGIVATGRSYVTASFNDIIESRGEGITFADESAGTVFENRISESGHAQVLLRTSGSPSFENNTISLGRADGVLVEAPATAEPPTFSRNVITDNQWSGVYLRGGAIARFRENLIARNRDNGLTIHERAAGDYESNVIAENGQNGVSLHGAGPAELILNRIRQNSWAGIYVSASAPRCDRNHVLENPWGAVSIMNGAGPKLKENDLSASGNAAVLIQDADGAFVNLNRIHGSAIGLDVRHGAVTVSANTIDENTTGLRLSPAAHLAFEQNSLAGNATVFDDPTNTLGEIASNHVIDDVDDVLRSQRTPVFLHRLDALDKTTWGASAAGSRTGPAPSPVPTPPPLAGTPDVPSAPVPEADTAPLPGGSRTG